MSATAHTATEIQAMVRTMDHSKRRFKHLQSRDPEAYMQSLRKENPVLFDYYPAIFALHADDKLSEHFFYMLQQKRRIERGEIDENAASVQVGKKLFDRWVAPVINGSGATTSTPMSYDEYYRSLQNHAQ